ncbi:hypothetical protein X798_03251 [Onchocerca flexuosa]|uniref:Uncharacterized protein n=1 Tax=Onchocerca flexuosa TaxID=387005 RepID=A0A238BYT4_9BILA|nr:hypothetical protein X798_03251 [Onchocerca flexuosa]
MLRVNCVLIAIAVCDIGTIALCAFQRWHLVSLTDARTCVATFGILEITELPEGEVSTGQMKVEYHLYSKSHCFTNHFSIVNCFNGFHPTDDSEKCHSEQVSPSATTDGCRFLKLNLWMSGVIFRRNENRKPDRTSRLLLAIVPRRCRKGSSQS